MSDHFATLNLPHRFAIDRTDLEREYRDRARASHPDHHGNDGTAAAAVNDAYRTLKDPVSRAEHLLALLGGPTAQTDKSQDQFFLMEMMDLRERIDSDDAAHAEIETDLTDRRHAQIDTVTNEFAKTTPDLRKIRRSLNAIKTLDSLLRLLAGEPEL
jgi:molecular chaperone HscB